MNQLNASRGALVALVLSLFLVAAPSVHADPILFESLSSIGFAQETGGVHYYDLFLSSDSYPYHEVYVVLDPDKVVAGAIGQVGSDASFVSAELLSHPGVGLFFSADARSVANVNNPRLLDDNEMDSYNPALTDALPDGTHDLALRLGFNRGLSSYEQHRIGYWVGDLRGMTNSAELFTESDGNPVPEPASMILTAVGLAGLYGTRRRRSRK